ncbi:uncharacterized protein LOC143459728 [Clavelina lepadiformis]|uniref:uncharacterized protein LOC143459728 n=1 Tax=Clavelina lepadiformis TaxID=159417 RepID=UPI004042B24E
MCCSKTCYKICTLGPLYRADNVKGRVQWLILILGKLLLPSLLLLISEQNEAESYRWAMHNFYKNKMQHHCQAYNDVPEYYGHDDILWSNLMKADVNSTRNQQDFKNWSSEEQKSESDEENLKEKVESLKFMLRELSQNNYYSFTRQKKRQKGYIPSEACCAKYRNVTGKTLRCLDMQGSSTSSTSFAIAMFYPLLGTIIVSAIMTPIKWNKKLQKKLLARGNRLEIDYTQEEMIKEIQACVQVLMDVIVFYFVVAKIWHLSKAIKTCIRFSLCQPSYVSYQVIYLLIIAQMPWMSTLWGFIYA